MDKFKRNYKLLIERRDGQLLQIQPPFTVEFDISRNSMVGLNVGSIRIYNLNADNRAQIRHDQYDWGDNRKVTFMAGYGDKLSLAFIGNISQAWSVREGNNMITQIESFDGSYAAVNGVTNQQFRSGTPMVSVIDALAQTLPGLKVGAIGNYEGRTSRGNSYSGSTVEILSTLTGGGLFIDNGKVHCLKDEECVAGNVPSITAASGLLGTPVRENLYVNLEMLFEPGLFLAQQVNLQSETGEGFNGPHKILSIKHRGMISEAVCGTAITSLGLLPGNFLPVAEQNG